MRDIVRLRGIAAVFSPRMFSRCEALSSCIGHLLCFWVLCVWEGGMHACVSVPCVLPVPL